MAPPPPTPLFSNFAGNFKAVNALKAGFSSHNVTIVVGAPRAGKSTFAACVRAHFAKEFTFHDVQSDRAVDLMRDVNNVLKRGVDVLTACGAPPQAAVRDKRKRCVLIDDVDVLAACDKALVRAIQKLASEGARFLLTVDQDNVRKLSAMKKGALVLYLVPPPSDSLFKWGMKHLLPEDFGDADVARLRGCAADSAGGVAELTTLFAGARLDKRDVVGGAWARMSSTEAASILFSETHDLQDLMAAAESEGGSMLGSIMWHNAPGISEHAYAERLRTTLDALVLERAGHLRGDRSLHCLGIALTIAPWCGTSAGGGVPTGLEYTRTVADMGTRQKARNAVADAAADVGVTMAEWVSRPKAPAKSRRSQTKV
jgi:hypothetical protein